MRVAQFLDHLAPAGKGRAAVELANGLAELGCDSFLVCTRGGGTLESTLDPRVETLFVKRRWRIDPLAFLRIARWLSEREVEVLHSHNHPSSYLARVVVRLMRRRIVHVGTDHDGAGSHSRRQALLDWIWLRNIDGLAGVNPELRDRAERLLGLPKECLAVIPGGVSIPSLPPAQAPEYAVVQIANIRPKKGIGVAIEAMAEVHRSDPSARWLLLGGARDEDRSLLASLQAEVERGHLSEHFILAGHQPDLTRFLERAQIAVSTSEAEGLSLGMLESMAAGLPVVTTDTGEGAAFVRETGAGVVVPIGDAHAIARSIRMLLADPEQCGEMGERGRKAVAAQYSSHAIAVKTLAWYHVVTEAS